MNERAAFEKFLNEHEDDATARLAFVDWLDEQGEHEEAERQRQWPAAKAWLVRFCQTCNPPPPPHPEDYPIAYEDLLELGRDAIVKDDGIVETEEEFWISCGTNESMCDALRSNTEEFWKNWAIVTGIPLPPKVVEKSNFRCAC